jgi:ubiquinone/menaquinone biosynthesis C-methylase UbiE
MKNKTMDTNNKNKPIALDGYEKMAKLFYEKSDTKPHNAYYERPATISLLPDVKGSNVLDAACGPGWYGEWLQKHGANVTCLDVSPKMIKYTKERLKDCDVNIICADLDKPLPLKNNSFDLAIMPLAMDYLKDINFSIGEISRVLTDSGIFVFSMGHPFYEFQKNTETDNYFAEELITYTWNGFGVPIEIPFFLRPLSAYTEALWENGFAIERMLEPRPTADFQKADPEGYEKLMKYPGFIFFRCKKFSSV